MNGCSAGNFTWDIPDFEPTLTLRSFQTDTIWWDYNLGLALTVIYESPQLQLCLQIHSGHFIFEDQNPLKHKYKREVWRVTQSHKNFTLDLANTSVGGTEPVPLVKIHRFLDCWKISYELTGTLGLIVFRGNLATDYHRSCFEHHPA